MPKQTDLWGGGGGEHSQFWNNPSKQTRCEYTRSEPTLVREVSSVVVSEVERNLA